MKLDLTHLPKEQQLEIMLLILDKGINPHIAYDHVVYGTPI